MTDFQDLQRRTLEIKAKYDELNLKQRRHIWTVKDYAMGFGGDVGDLMKLVAAKEGVRAGADIDSQLGHELADCLWSVIVLADHYGIDLGKEFVRTMNYLEKRIAKELEP
jgi:NTP pyrophosphatase (non-canonical NTP hydrolase)